MIIIRPERAGDEQAIHDVTAAAFEGHPHSDQSEPFIIERLRGEGALMLSLVAEEEGQIVGHVAFSPVTLTPPAAGWFGLGPVAVMRERQANGIGSRLIREGLAMLAADGALGCVVVGDPDYYQKFRFRHESSLVFPGCAPQYFMALAFSGAVPTGTVAYHPAFGTE
ncbi:acetyltransferase [Ensifer adhaerens OV14]|jgi:putative acetyltransferase|nr:N-acetyltransferase [Ensifer canadensis]AHK44335.1 acetyltransferase [Ensifer adhaerens OV14]MDP9634508.1 putative acetyltransferase [Ensifer adhaerens]